ncbi:MAG: thymidine kinase [Proteobacteria bacterium]|nr:MAG: thymidine kinase [Pseudomonadota bacterium]
MAKLYFRYGTVGSAKTLNLLAVAHAYQQQNKKAFLIKPRIDTRFGADAIGSRAGLIRNADLLVDEDSQIPVAALSGCHCILVDEVQFLSESLIEQLRSIANDLNIPVICYGLRTDFRGRLFPGSQRLMELSDAIEEVKTTCSFCNRKAIFNLKLTDGQPTLDGPVIELGKEEKYIPTCPNCYDESLNRLQKAKVSSGLVSIPMSFV